MILFKIFFIGMWVANYFFSYGLCAFVMKKRFTNVLSLLLFVIGCSGITVFRYWYIVGGGLEAVPSGIYLSSIAIFLLQVLLFKGKWHKQLVNFAIIAIFSMFAEVLCSFSVTHMVGEFETFNFNDRCFRFSIMFFYPALSLMIYPTFVILRRANRIADAEKTGGYMWLVVTFPFSQIFMMNLYSGVTTVVKPIGIIGAGIGLVADFLLIIFLEKEHKGSRWADELEEEKQLLAYEKMAYQDLVFRQEEIAQLRHDYQNQLMALKALK